jgi:hypothetical protein
VNVAELIDILRDFEPDTIVEMAIVAPVSPDADEITVDQFEVEGVMLRDPADSGGDQVVWLIGGDSNDVEEFIDAMESVSGESAPGEMHSAHRADVIDLERATTSRR